LSAKSGIVIGLFGFGSAKLLGAPAPTNERECTGRKDEDYGHQVMEELLVVHGIGANLAWAELDGRVYLRNGVYGCVALLGGKGHRLKPVPHGSRCEMATGAQTEVCATGGGHDVSCPYEKRCGGSKTTAWPDSLLLWRFPEFDAVAVGVGDPGEFAELGVVALGIDFDSGFG
jgi:hypothetical protein